MRTATAPPAPARPLAMSRLVALTALVFGMANMGVYADDADNTNNNDPSGAPTILPTISSYPTARPSPVPSPAPTKDLNKFMCFTGRNSCPDEGKQSRTCGKNDGSNCPGEWSQEGSAAGTLTVAVHQAIHLPDMDLNLGASGESDPFVEAIVRRRDISSNWVDVANRRTHHEDSDLSPVWNEELNMGVHDAASQLVLKVFDYDTGVNGLNGHDPLGSAAIFTPYCSMFFSDEETVNYCDEETCESSVSTWAMPDRRVCNSTVWLALEDPLKIDDSKMTKNRDGDSVNAQDDDTLGTKYGRYDNEEKPAWKSRPDKSDCKFGCIEITMSVVPFEVAVHPLHPNSLKDDSDWASGGVKSKGCKWVAKKPESRCSGRSLDGTRASVACPVACERPVTEFEEQDGYMGLSVANEPSTEDWNEDWGYINVEGSNVMTSKPEINWKTASFKQLKGGLLVQTQFDDRYLKGDFSYARLAINYDAILHVCRYQDEDGDDYYDGHTWPKKWGSEIPRPRWLDDDGWQQTDRFAQCQDPAECGNMGSDSVRFVCYRKFFEGTPMNKYGSFEREGVITIGGNLKSAGAITKYNYFVVAQPVLEGSREVEPFVLSFDAGAFIVMIITFLPVYVFISMGDKFLQAVDFRIDRIDTWLCTQVTTGKEKSVLGQLFVTYMNSEENFEWRQNMYYAKLSVQVCLAIPFVMLWTWGACCVAQVSPPGVGFFILFIGTAAKLTWFGFTLWKRTGWCMSPIIFMSFALAFMSTIFFCVAVVLLDPAVHQGGQPYSFLGLSMVMFTLNAIPMIPYYFAKDDSVKNAMKQFMFSINAASKDIRSKSAQRQTAGLTKDPSKGEGVVKQSIHYILDGCYSLHASIPMMKYSKAVLAYDPSDHHEIERKCYRTSMAVLVLYLLLAFLVTPNIMLAVLNVAVLLFFDYMHGMMGHGSEKWTTGFNVCICCAGRLCLAIGGFEYWMLGYSLAYIAYGGAISGSVINKFLPFVTAAQAGSSVFFGNDLNAKKHHDLAGAPGFVLSILSFLFLFVIMVATFVEPKELPLPDIMVGDKAWNVYVFGVLAFMIVMVIAMADATFRAVYLAGQKLLKAPFDKLYLWHPAATTPVILSIGTYCVVILAGLFTYASTNTAFAFTSAVFVPLIVATAGVTYSRWRANDYLLVVWPPVDDKKVAADNQMTDQEMSMGMLEGFLDSEGGGGGEGGSNAVVPYDGGGGGIIGMGNQSDGIAAGRSEKMKGDGRPGKFQKGMDGVRLPTLEKTGPEQTTKINMPMLPPKAVIKKKRAEGAGAVDHKTSKQMEKDAYEAEREADLMAEFGTDLYDSGTAGGAGATKQAWGEGGGAASSAASHSGSTVKLPEKRHKRNSLDASGGPLVFVKRYCKKSKTYVSDSVKACKSKVKNLGKKSKKVTPAIDDEERKALVEALQNEDNGMDADGWNKDRDGGDDDEEESSEEESSEEEEEEESDEEMDFDDMPFFQAFMEGWLLTDEYTTLGLWALMVGLIVAYSVVVASSDAPTYFGLLLGSSALTLLFTIIPIHQWFHRYELRDSMKLEIALAGVLHTVAISTMYGAGLDDQRNNNVDSLWLLNAFLMYPLIVGLSFEFLNWKDIGWVIEPLDKDGDGKLSPMEVLMFIGSTPVAVGAGSFLMLEVAVFGPGYYFAVTSILLYVAFVKLMMAVYNWAKNDFYLEESFQKRGQRMIFWGQVISILLGVASAVPALGLDGLDFVYCMSVFFVLYITNQAILLGARYFQMDSETVIYLSPYIFPIFTYTSESTDLTDETHQGVRIFKMLGAGLCWGITMAILITPVNVGITFICFFLLAIAAVAAICVQFIPLQLGDAARFVSDRMLIDAGKMTYEVARKRREKFTLYNKEWDEIDEVAENEWEDDLGAALFSDKQWKNKLADMGMEQASDIASKMMAKEKDLRYRTNKRGKDEVRDDAMYNYKDALAAAMVGGHGPFAFLFGSGAFFRLYMKVGGLLKKEDEQWATILEDYDKETGQRKDNMPGPNYDHKVVLEEFKYQDEDLTKAFFEEFRAFAHFQLLVVNAAGAYLEREKILFQKFLRENRFKLLSNGIAPPKDIFNSSSFASIDITLVAVWLSGLNPDEIERFHLLKRHFSEEVGVKERDVDRHDQQTREASHAIMDKRKVRENDMAQKRHKEFRDRYERRLDQWLRALPAEDKSRFNEKKNVWMRRPNAPVDERDMDLRERFDNEVVLKGADEGMANAQKALAELESGDTGCRVSKHRRMQFYDASFPADGSALGRCEVTPEVCRWMPAIAINPDSRLFDEGTDPDDVFTGRIKSKWLMSALSMLSAAGGVGDADVDEQILRLFVGQIGPDGKPMYGTDVGAYGVRLYKNGQWETVIVDDLFPMLVDTELVEAEDKNSMGVACAYSKGFTELWVPLIEKAYAKYYGSYAAIEDGFVHHALHDMTACETECIFMAAASRGAGKRALWGKMNRFKKNGYIMGAGTVAEHLADRQIQDMGLVFDSTYTVYEVREENGVKMLKLRNPPGDHDEWKGDWSDESTLWTRRTKHRLNVTVEDDNTFWMAFDDFCNCFRCLYVCRWYDPHRWQTQQLTAIWQNGEGGDENAYDTTAGLPTKHNPGCEVVNNPQFAFHIHRPTDIKIKIVQPDVGEANVSEVLPIAAFLCRPKHLGVAGRIQELSKDNIITDTGQPVRDREFNMYASLSPGVYILLVGTYVAGMEGQVDITVMSNYVARTEQIWPPVWTPEKEPTTFAEKMQAEAKKKILAAADGVAAGAAKADAKIKEAKANAVAPDPDEGDEPEEDKVPGEA